MSYTPEILKKKLSTLNETQESIVTISHWIIFHHRYAQSTSQIWSEYTNESPIPKKLPLLYLCNDVVQQARAKRKTEFIIEFGKVLPLVIYKTYGLMNDQIKSKIDRLVKVWQDRNIFSTKVINDLKEAIEKSTSINASDKKSTNESTPDFGSSNSSSSNNNMSSISPELMQLSTLYTTLATTTSTNLSHLSKITVTYNQLFESENLPSPKIYLSKLTILEKLCNIGINGIDETIKTKQLIATVLDKMSASIKESTSKEYQKKSLIDSKLSKVLETVAELKEMVHEESPVPPSVSASISTPTPTQTAIQQVIPVDEDEDEDLPMYENSSGEEDDKDEREGEKVTQTGEQGTNSPRSETERGSESDQKEDSQPPTKKLKFSEENTSTEHKVSFAEEVQVETIPTEEELNEYPNTKSNTPHGNDVSSSTVTGEDENVQSFTNVPKDDLALKMQHDEHENKSPSKSNAGKNDDDDDEYDPSSMRQSKENNEINHIATAGNNSNVGLNPDVLSLLSKLANN